MSFEDEILKLARKSPANSESYGIWGKQAAKRYIENGVPLADSISKTASAQGLNPDEISRVVEAANLEVFDHKLKTADNRAFEFDVANRDEVIQNLGLHSTEKTSMPSVFFTDYDSPLPQNLSRTNGQSDFWSELAGLEGQRKVASPKLAENLLERLKFAAEDIRYKQAANLERFAESSEELYSHIKQQVLGGKDYEAVADAIMSKAEGGPHEDRMKELLGWAKRKLVDSGVLLTHTRHGDTDLSPEKEKKAEPVEEALITDALESPGVPVHIINGRHPLFATLDTLVQQFDEADKNNHNLIILEDKIRYVKRRVGGQNEQL
jgi:hypothetical protein